MKRALTLTILGLCVSLPAHACMPTPEEVKRDFEAIDTNSDGKIDMPEHEKSVADFTKELRDSPYAMSEDQDRDGVVTLAEYKGIGRKSLSPKLIYLTEARIQRYFAAADLDKDGKLTETEYFHDVKPIEAMHKNLRSNIFGKADADKDGFVTKTEYERYLRKDPHTIITLEQYEAYFRELDTNVDATLTKDEYFKPADELKNVKAEFYAADADNNGSISFEEYSHDAYPKSATTKRCGGR